MTSGTIESYQRSLNLFLKWLQDESIQPEQASYADVLSYMKHCQKRGTTQRTVTSYVLAIRHFYSHLIEEKIIEINPCTGVKVKGVRRKKLYYLFSAQELHSLYNNFQDESLKGKRNKVMLGLLCYQGLKTEELANLEVKDVKLKEGKIEVPGSVKGEARMLRLESHQVLEVYDYVLQVRKEILKHSQEETDKFFVGIEGGGSLDGCMTRLMVHLRKQNSRVINAKQIRASVIVKWLRQYNLREVQHMAGHRYISSTEAYRQSEMEGLTEEINKFHPLG